MDEHTYAKAAYEELVRQWHTARNNLSNLQMQANPDYLVQKQITGLQAWITHLSQTMKIMRPILVAQGILEPRRI